MKNFKFFSRILCIFVLVLVFSFNTFAMSISDFAPFDDEYLNNRDVLTSATVSNRNWLGDASVIDGFKFTDSLLSSNDFIFSESLPYGEKTVVIACRNSINSVIYLNFLDPNVLSDFYQTYNTKNGRCAFQILSESPIYRIGYGLKNGNVVSYNSVFGLTNQTSSEVIGDKTFYLFSYTLTDNDYYLIASNLNSNISMRFKDGDTSWISTQGIDYDVDSYPFFSNYSNIIQNQQNNLIEQGNQLQEEQNKTSKSIWESIKSLPDIISDKLKGLFVPDEGFFSEYFTKLQNFFSEKLGFLVYPFDFIITFLRKYLDIGDGDGILHLPDFAIMDVKIFNQTDFNLKNAMSSFLGEYYGIYFAFVDFIILVGLVNLALKKFNSISGGGTE